MMESNNLRSIFDVFVTGETDSLSKSIFDVFVVGETDSLSIICVLGYFFTLNSQIF